MSWKVFFTIVALMLMAMFVLQNMEVVSVRFFIWSMEASRVIVYLVIFLIGALTGWIGKSLRKR